jgi:hypothetical protein
MEEGKSVQSLRLRRHSGLRQSGIHSSRKKPRGEMALFFPKYLF